MMVRCDKCGKPTLKKGVGCNLGRERKGLRNLCPKCWYKWSDHFLNDIAKKLNPIRNDTKDWIDKWYEEFDLWLGIIRKEKVIFT